MPEFLSIVKATGERKKKKQKYNKSYINIGLVHVKNMGMKTQNERKNERKKKMKMNFNVREKRENTCEICELYNKKKEITKQRPKNEQQRKSM